MTIDIIKQEYNKFEQYPMLSYNIISHIMDNNDLIWKLLKYTDANAWKSDIEHPNLTKSEKGLLIYDGLSDETKYRVFMDTGEDQVWTEEVCMLRIYPMDVLPVTYVYGNVSMAFEVYCHYKINQLSNYQTRINIIGQQLLEVLNGAEIGGLGRLYFDRAGGSKSRLTTIGQIPYKGIGLLMCNYVV